MNKNKVSNVLKGFMAIAIYFLSSTTDFNIWILKVLNINYLKWNDVAVYAYLIFYQLLVCTIIFYIFRKQFKECFIKFKNSFKKYISRYIKYWFLTLGLMMFSNIIIQMIASGIAQNEQAVREMLELNPVYTFIASVIIAPFLEESIFRLSIRNIIPKYKWLYVFISGISFGLLHVIGNISVWTDWLFIVPYSIPGCIFAYTLVKSDNIFVPISLHTIHNGILITIQLLL